MKKWFLFTILISLFSFTTTLQAQIKFGVKGGANFSDLNIKDYKTNSATGWFIGPTTEFVMPIIGIGLDASLLYSRVKSEVLVENTNEDYKLDYLSIPVNIRYKFNLLLIKPFLFAGPEFNVKVHDNFEDVWDHLSDMDIKNPFKSNNAEMKLNVGAGIQVLDKLEVFFNYNFGLTNSIRSIDSKTSIWKVGGAIYF